MAAIGTRPRPVARAPSRLGPALRLPRRGRWAATVAVAAPAAIVAVAAVLRAWGLGRQGLWYDEAVTAWLVRGTPGQMLAALPHSESTPPLYYLLAWGWVRAFGDTATGLRALSALAGTVTVAVAFAAGRSLVSRRVGLMAAALVAVNPLLVWYSQEARSYALLVLLGALALWLALRVREDPTAGRLLAWALAGGLMLATHYFAVFVVAPQAVLVLAERRAVLRRRLLAVGLVAAAGASLAQLALVQRTRTYWFLGRPLSFRAEQIVQQFLVGFRPPATTAAALVAGAAVAAAGVVLAARGERAERRGAALAAMLGLGAVGLPLAVALAGTDYVNTRNVLGALAPLALAVACALGVRRARLLGVGLAAVLVGVSLWALAALAHDRLAQRPPWARVAAALDGGLRPRAILLEGSSTWARPLGLLLAHTWWLGPRGARVREIDVVRRLPTAGDCPGDVVGGRLRRRRSRDARRPARPRPAPRRPSPGRRVRGHPLPGLPPRSRRPGPRSPSQAPAHADARADRPVSARPPRILILTADVGEGHFAAGRALGEDLRGLGAEVVERDGLAALGAVARHVIRDGYRVQLRVAPWSYAAMYRLFMAAPPLRALGAAVLGALGRRGLAALVACAVPDIVVSTHPALTCVLGGLRRRRRLRVPLCAPITDLADFAVWAHPGADVHLVVHPAAVARVEAVAGPGSATVARPPVARAFRDRLAREEARAVLALPAAGALVAVSGGGWGVGDLEGAATAALGAGAPIVLVLAGRDAAVLAALRGRFAAEPRVRVLGFTERMDAVLHAADVLVHSTGGMTSLEALSCGCPMIAYGSTVGHIRVHNRTLAALGLAVLAETPAELAVARWTAGSARRRLRPGHCATRRIRRRSWPRCARGCARSRRGAWGWSAR